MSSIESIAVAQEDYYKGLTKMEYEKRRLPFYQPSDPENYTQKLVSLILNILAVYSKGIDNGRIDNEDVRWIYEKLNKTRSSSYDQVNAVLEILKSQFKPGRIICKQELDGGLDFLKSVDYLRVAKKYPVSIILTKDGRWQILFEEKDSQTGYAYAHLGKNGQLQFFFDQSDKRASELNNTYNIEAIFLINQEQQSFKEYGGLNRLFEKCAATYHISAKNASIRNEIIAKNMMNVMDVMDTILEETARDAEGRKFIDVSFEDLTNYFKKMLSATIENENGEEFEIFLPDQIKYGSIPSPIHDLLHGIFIKEIDVERYLQWLYNQDKDFAEKLFPIIQKALSRDNSNTFKIGADMEYYPTIKEMLTKEQKNNPNSTILLKDISQQQTIDTPATINWQNNLNTYLTSIKQNLLAIKKLGDEPSVYSGVIKQIPSNKSNPQSIKDEQKKYQDSLNKIKMEIKKIKLRLPNLSDTQKIVWDETLYRQVLLIVAEFSQNDVQTLKKLNHIDLIPYITTVLEKIIAKISRTGNSSVQLNGEKYNIKNFEQNPIVKLLQSLQIVEYQPKEIDIPKPEEPEESRLKIYNVRNYIRDNDLDSITDYRHYVAKKANFIIENSSNKNIFYLLNEDNLLEEILDLFTSDRNSRSGQYDSDVRKMFENLSRNTNQEDFLTGDNLEIRKQVTDKIVKFVRNMDQTNPIKISSFLKDVLDKFRYTEGKSENSISLLKDFSGTSATIKELTDEYNTKARIQKVNQARTTKKDKEEMPNIIVDGISDNRLKTLYDEKPNITSYIGRFSKRPPQWGKLEIITELQPFKGVGWISSDDDVSTKEIPVISTMEQLAKYLNTDIFDLVKNEFFTFTKEVTFKNAQAILNIPDGYEVVSVNTLFPKKITATISVNRLGQTRVELVTDEKSSNKTPNVNLILRKKAIENSKFNDLGLKFANCEVSENYWDTLDIPEIHKLALKNLHEKFKNLKNNVANLTLVEKTIVQDLIAILNNLCVDYELSPIDEEMRFESNEDKFKTDIDLIFNYQVGNCNTCTGIMFGILSKIGINCADISCFVQVKPEKNELYLSGHGKLAIYYSDGSVENIDSVYIISQPNRPGKDFRRQRELFVESLLNDLSSEKITNLLELLDEIKVPIKNQEIDQNELNQIALELFLHKLNLTKNTTHCKKFSPNSLNSTINPEEFKELDMFRFFGKIQTVNQRGVNFVPATPPKDKATTHIQIPRAELKFRLTNSMLFESLHSEKYKDEFEKRPFDSTEGKSDISLWKKFQATVDFLLNLHSQSEEELGKYLKKVYCKEENIRSIESAGIMYYQAPNISDFKKELEKYHIDKNNNTN